MASFTNRQNMLLITCINILYNSCSNIFLVNAWSDGEIHKNRIILWNCKVRGDNLFISLRVKWLYICTRGLNCFSKFFISFFFSLSYEMYIYWRFHVNKIKHIFKTEIKFRKQYGNKNKLRINNKFLKSLNLITFSQCAFITQILSIDLFMHQSCHYFWPEWKVSKYEMWLNKVNFICTFKRSTTITSANFWNINVTV